MNYQQACELATKIRFEQPLLGTVIPVAFGDQSYVGIMYSGHSVIAIDSDEGYERFLYVCSMVYTQPTREGKLEAEWELIPRPPQEEKTFPMMENPVSQAIYEQMSIMDLPDIE